MLSLLTFKEPDFAPFLEQGLPLTSRRQVEIFSAKSMVLDKLLDLGNITWWILNMHGTFKGLVIIPF